MPTVEGLLPERVKDIIMGQKSVTHMTSPQTLLYQKMWKRISKSSRSTLIYPLLGQSHRPLLCSKFINALMELLLNASMSANSLNFGGTEANKTH